MPIVQTRVVIDAPVETVWKVVSDPRNLPRWDRHVMAVRGVPDSGLVVGAEYSTELRLMGVHGKVRARVLELRPPELSRIRVSGLLDAVVETKLSPLDGDRTRLDQRVDFRFVGGPFGVFAAGAVRRLGAQRILDRGVLAQKAQAEAAR